MGHQVEHCFEVPVPPERAWRAFVDSGERSQWEATEFTIDPRPGGRVHWTLPGHESEGRVEEVVPERLIRHSEASGPHSRTEVTIRLEPVGDGTRISITHSGFGDGLEAEWAVESVRLGWAQAIADLQVWLRHGVAADRFVRRMVHAGVQLGETPAGLTVLAVEPGGFAERAGLRPGDLILALGGVPVFTRPEHWVVMRSHAPGDKLSVEFVREGGRHTATAEL